MLRKAVCILAALATVISVLGVSVSADGYENYYGRRVLSEMPNSEALVYAYDKMVEAVDAHMEDPFSVYDGTHALSVDEFRMVRDVYSRDYAQHFWLGTRWSYGGNGNTVMTAQFEYIMPVGQIAEARRKFDERVEAILAQITPEMSEFDIELLIHDAIAQNTVYKDGANAHNAYGALVEGEAVCEGYAEAFQYLLHCAGIGSFLAIGTSTNVTTGVPEGHEWNYVKIDGKWYQADVTWDDHSRIFHAYFNLSDEMIAADHTASPTAYPLPKCDSDDAFYFKVKSGLLDNYDVTSVAEILNASDLHASVYVGNSAEFTEWFQANVFDIAAAIGVTGGYSYGFSRAGNEVVIYIDPIQEPVPDPTPGDVNGDNRVNAKDIIAVMKYMLGSAPEGFIEAAADLNGDNRINAKDIILIMKIMLGGK